MVFSLNEDTRYLDKIDLLDKLKFCNISANFKDAKMVDHILKISRLDVFDTRCLNWIASIIVFMKKCHMEQRRYKSSHLIPMFTWTSCTYL